MDQATKTIGMTLALGVAFGFFFGLAVGKLSMIPVEPASPEYVYETFTRPRPTLPSDLDNWINQKTKAYRMELVSIQELGDHYLVLMRGRKQP